MQISNDSLDEFMKTYQAEFGKDIFHADALEMATRLINLYQIIYQPLRSDRDVGTKWSSE